MVNNKKNNKKERNGALNNTFEIYKTVQISYMYILVQWHIIFRNIYIFWKSNVTCIWRIIGLARHVNLIYLYDKIKECIYMYMADKVWKVKTEINHLILKCSIYFSDLVTGPDKGSFLKYLFCYFNSKEIPMNSNMFCCKMNKRYLYSYR